MKDDLRTHMHFVFRTALFFMSFCLLVWAFVPQWQPVAAGLVLGTVISLINARLLAYKIELMTKHVMENTGKRVNLGFIARASMSIIGVMVCLKFEQFDLMSAVCGLFYVQAVTLLKGLISAANNNGMHGKG
ncbi:ATP synthase subunit I [Paenibacillus senegalensis]|uniref:ATP synthase subunit I n=1 Tax=Paenibacillus senegalensis TaxID=1465766 RepID=UPI0002885CF8|nr:ATP synthase subunit I [Paenibacillus senegalensis]